MIFKTTKGGKEPAPASVTVSSVEELRQKLSEGLSDIEAGRVISAAAVNQRLQEKYGISRWHSFQ